MSSAKHMLVPELVKCFVTEQSKYLNTLEVEQLTKQTVLHCHFADS